MSRVSEQRTKLSVFVICFLVALIVPIIFNLGPVRLASYRVVLVVAFFPSVYVLLSGRAGRLILSDGLVLLMILWIAISNIVHIGPAQSVEPSGILTLEILGAYLVGRSFITTPEAFRKMAGLLILICFFLLPFALYETLTAHNLILTLWKKVGFTNPDVYKEARLGLDRVQGPFDHPIHFGVFIAPILGLAYFVYGYGWKFIRRIVLTGLVFLTGFLALSSGPISAFFAQIGLILWNAVFRKVPGHWWILLALTVLAYILIDILSNRSPIVVAISYLALNPGTGYGRLLIWEWGWVNILNAPLFGIGSAEWERLPWMTPSFDMYWLFFAMKYGVVVGIAHVGAFCAMMVGAIRSKTHDDKIAAYRLGWIVSAFGFFMAGWMVHFWNAPFAFYSFILGSGAWLLNYNAEDDHPAEADQPEEVFTPTSRYTRFPQKKSVTAPVHRRKRLHERETSPVQSGPAYPDRE